MEAKLERQRGELQEVQELLAEAAATNDSEFIEEASQEVASREVCPLRKQPVLRCSPQESSKKFSFRVPQGVANCEVSPAADLHLQMTFSSTSSSTLPVCTQELRSSLAVSVSIGIQLDDFTSVMAGRAGEHSTYGG